MFPGYCEPLTTEPLNQEKLDKGEGGEKNKRATPTAPRHGARSQERGTIFILHGTPDWAVYAKDFRDFTGAEPLPNRFNGKWFFANGEAARPAHQRAWRNRNAFGAARGRQ